MINSPLLPLAYDSIIVEPLKRGGGGGAGVIYSPVPPLAYDNRIVELRIGGVGWGE